jgi:hypothetical protein
MDKYKKASLESPYLGFVGAMVLLALLSSSGLYAPSFGVQEQYQPQQFDTVIFAGSNENNTTTAPSNANATTSVANGTTMASILNATLVEFVSNIEQIRGHLDQALINKESGNNSLAQTHTLHPIEEVYSSIEVQLANQNSTLNQTLSAALQSLSSSATNVTLQEFESQTDHVNTLLNNSVQTVVPTSELDSNPEFNASVVARLLHVAGREYEEAVVNGTVKAIVEYQDAQAFIYRAQSIFNSSTGRINQSMAPEVEKIHELFSNLNGAINNKGDPETVKTIIINKIIHELAEMTGLSESQLVGEETRAAEHDTIAIINDIKSLLNQQLLSTYRSQDYEGAENIAIEAYLENYENIEQRIAEHDPALMKQTEVMLREELRQMIKDRVPVEQIQQQVSMINANLDKAAELLQ